MVEKCDSELSIDEFALLWKHCHMRRIMFSKFEDLIVKVEYFSIKFVILVGRVEDFDIYFICSVYTMSHFPS